MSLKKSLFDYRGKLTRIICIDEFKASTIAGEYAFVIGDPISGKIIDILPSRKQDYIYYYFQSIPDEERFNVKYIVTDLFESYKSIAETLFWKSIHIADRFHWIKPIVNSFIIDIETKTKLTNGFIEGKNNMIKTIKRVGFGFKDFDIFRAKILHVDDEDKPFKNK